MAHGVCLLWKNKMKGACALVIKPIRTEDSSRHEAVFGLMGAFLVDDLDLYPSSFPEEFLMFSQLSLSCAK